MRGCRGDLPSASESLSTVIVTGTRLLVLDNGKRRHTGASVNLGGAVGRASAPADLNAIPLSSIDHIEVLRDGAAARYGSDAIAGLINIILKDANHGGEISTKYGSYKKGDGIPGKAVVPVSH